MILAKRIIMAVVGFTIIGFAIAVLRIINLGMDPLGAMALGISYLTGISFGNVLVIVQAPLLLLVLWKQKKLIGIGTIMGMFGVGYVIDFFYFVAALTPIAYAEPGLVVRLVILMLALVVLSIGASIYMVSNLGMIPYDSTGFVLEGLTNGKIKFKWIRLAMDGMCAIVAIALGAIVGIATAMTVFSVGPLISLFKGKIGTFAQRRILV